MFRNTVFGISIVLFALSALILLRSNSEDSNTKTSVNVLQRTRNCIAKIPDSLSFAGEPVPLSDEDVYERLDREIQINTFYHSSTIQMLKLAPRWFPVIEKVLKENGVPDDFKYMAAAESGLRNTISPAGAKGIWQFLHSTGEEYGLTINYYVDERYNVIQSTEAACRFLKKAYEKFGSWTLAAAAYNRGMNGIDSDLQDQKVKSYYNLYLNSETARYVFRILALKTILSDPGDYGFCFDETELYKPLNYSTVEIDTSIDNLVNFAKQNGTNYKMLKFLNPWLRRESLIVHGDQKYDIKLPS